MNAPFYRKCFDPSSCRHTACIGPDCKFHLDHNTGRSVVDKNRFGLYTATPDEIPLAHAFTLKPDLEEYYANKSRGTGKTVGELVAEDAAQGVWYCMGCENEREK